MGDGVSGRGILEEEVHMSTTRGDEDAAKPSGREEWPEDFWKAFDGMSPDFECPPQRRQRREDWTRELASEISDGASPL